MQRSSILIPKRKKTHAGKGSSFERLIGQRLSLWMSDGVRKDMFSRNVLSGGQFTVSRKRGVMNHGIGGDLIAIHADAMWFTDRWHIECKHVKDLQLHSLLYRDKTEKSFLKPVIAQARAQAESVGKDWIVICRQNNGPILCFLDQRTWRDEYQQLLYIEGKMVYMLMLEQFLLNPEGK